MAETDEKCRVTRRVGSGYRVHVDLIALSHSKCLEVSFFIDKLISGSNNACLPSSERLMMISEMTVYIRILRMENGKEEQKQK